MADRFDSENDYNPHGEHVVEIPAHDQYLYPARRRSYATLGVAVFLALAGIGITVGLISDQSRRASNDATEREELRVGWQMLGTLAADGAEHDPNAAAQPATTVTPPSSPPSVVVVNVPAQSPANAAPMAGTVVQVAPTGVVAPAAPAQAPTANTAAQPAANGVLPVAVPVPASAPLPNGAPQAAAPAQTGLNGTVPASPPVQSLPSGSEPLSPITYPASQMCGMSTCDVGSVCCNASCGICTAPGATCTQQACG